MGAGGGSTVVLARCKDMIQRSAVAISKTMSTYTCTSTLQFISLEKVKSYGIKVMLLSCPVTCICMPAVKAMTVRKQLLVTAATQYHSFHPSQSKRRPITPLCKTFRFNRQRLCQTTTSQIIMLPDPYTDVQSSLQQFHLCEEEHDCLSLRTDTESK